MERHAYHMKGLVSYIKCEFHIIKGRRNTLNGALYILKGCFHTTNGALHELKGWYITLLVHFNVISDQLDTLMGCTLYFKGLLNKLVL